MKIEDQVCSLEQSKKLCEFGITQIREGFWWANTGKAEGEMWDVINKEAKGKQLDISYVDSREQYIKENEKNYLYLVTEKTDIGITCVPLGRNLVGEHYRAFTVAELGVMLPEYIESHRATSIKGYWYCGKLEQDDGDGWKVEGTQAQAMAAYLLYLIDIEFTTVNEINERLLQTN